MARSATRLRVLRFVVVSGVVFAILTGVLCYVYFRYLRVWRTDFTSLAAIPYAEPGEWPDLATVEFEGVIEYSGARTHEVELHVSWPGSAADPIQVFVPKTIARPEDYPKGSRHVFVGRVLSGHIVKPSAVDFIQVASWPYLPREKVLFVLWVLSAAAMLVSISLWLFKIKARDSLGKPGGQQDMIA